MTDEEILALSNFQTAESNFVEAASDEKEVKRACILNISQLKLQRQDISKERTKLKTKKLRIRKLLPTQTSRSKTLMMKL